LATVMQEGGESIATEDGLGKMPTMRGTKVRKTIHYVLLEEMSFERRCLIFSVKIGESTLVDVSSVNEADCTFENISEKGEL
jgi:hypothetical protein